MARPDVSPIEPAQPKILPLGALAAGETAGLYMQEPADNTAPAAAHAQPAGLPNETTPETSLASTPQVEGPAEQPNLSTDNFEFRDAAEPAGEKAPHRPSLTERLDTIEDLIADTLAKVHELDERVVAATDVSTGKVSAADVRVGLAEISKSLETAAGYVDHVKETDSAEQPKEVPREPAPLGDRLAASVYTLTSLEEAPLFLKRALNKLHETGLDTNLKVLLAGKHNLGRMYQVSSKTIDLLAEKIAEHIPEIPLSDGPNIELAAQTYSSIQEVPLVIVAPGNEVLRALSINGHKGVLVHQLFTTNRVELLLANNPAMKGYLRDLRHQTAKYAAAFNEARRMLA
jgi:hypothetical protein